MTIDKALRPSTLRVAGPSEPEIEIEVASDDAQEGEQDDGSVVVDLGDGAKSEKLGKGEFGENLLDTLDAAQVTILVGDLERDIDNDKRSRSDWEKTYKEGLKLMGLKTEERTEPWDGACGIVHPMITEAVVRFQAECVTETFPAAGPVRSKIVGLETPETKDAAKRVETDMNWRLTEQMPEFRPEHERMLFELPAVGSTFKKVYFDPALDRQTSVFISAEDVILPYGCTNIFASHRVTHVLRKTANEIRALMEEGFYDSFDVDDVPPKQTDDVKDAKDKEVGVLDLYDERYVIYEAHADLVIEGDPMRDPGSKVAYPYVVSFIRNSNTQILSIRRNWKEQDGKHKKRQHFVQYNYVPGFGAYGYGLFHLIGGYATSATSLIRQLIDAGTLSNLPGGLKARGLRIKGDDTPIAPGEFRDVDLGGGKISDNIMPLPYKEPSATLATILEKVIEDGRRFAATADLQISDMSSQAPVGTTLAILERQLKVLTAVQARVHDSLKKELALLKECIADYTSDSYEYQPETGKKSDKKKDYQLVEIIPVSDPNASTLSQRVIQGQTALQMASMAPEVYDMAYLHREMLDTLGMKNIEKIIPLPDDMDPLDPVTENMAIINCKPVKAFIYQDQLAHISVHQAAMQDPMMMQIMGQNPKAPMILAAAQAHIAEHVAFYYRERVEQELGITLPPPGQPMPPQAEVALSGMMAQAAQQVLAQSKAQAAVAAAQAAANDPALQLQQQELAIKQQQAGTQHLKVVGDLLARADDHNLRQQEVQGKMQMEGARLGIDAQDRQAKVVGQNMQAGVKTGLDVARFQHEQQQAVHENQRAAVDQQHQHRMAEDQQRHQQNMDHLAHEQGVQQFQHTVQKDGQSHQLAADKMRGDFSAQVHQQVTGQQNRAEDNERADAQRFEDHAMQQVGQEQQREHDMAKTKLSLKQKAQTAQSGGKKPAVKSAVSKKTAKKPPAK